jgi:hypothetical protein
VGGAVGSGAAVGGKGVGGGRVGEACDTGREGRGGGGDDEQAASTDRKSNPAANRSKIPGVALKIVSPCVIPSESLA